MKRYSDESINNKKKTEDVDSIISTALSETRVLAPKPKRALGNVRQRIGEEYLLLYFELARL